eukprot:13562802-Heterocapsa_arctica.AAC.1
MRESLLEYDDEDLVNIQGNDFAEFLDAKSVIWNFHDALGVEGYYRWGKTFKPSKDLECWQ